MTICDNCGCWFDPVNRESCPFCPGFRNDREFLVRERSAVHPPSVFIYTMTAPAGNGTEDISVDGFSAEDPELEVF